MRTWLAGWLPAFLGLVGDVWTAVRVWIGRNLAELAAVAGGLYLSDGVGQVYAPAEPILGGLLLIVGAYCLARSRGV
ncbi:MAG: hypothetical protein ABIQ18_35900 [Umezawaea sp.]